MSRPMYFHQECPTCGRCLEIRVEHLGRTLECRHCRGQFEAYQSTEPSRATFDSGLALLKKVDDLLAAAAAASSVHLKRAEANERNSVLP